MVEVLFRPNRALLKRSFPHVELLRVEAGRGLKAFGYLVQPAVSAGPAPLIITMYDCNGFLRGGTGDEYPIYPWVSRGFAVLCFDPPKVLPELSDKLSEREYHATMDGAVLRGPLAVQSTLGAAMQLGTKRGNIDVNRIGITGLSYGAQVAWFSLLQRKDLRTAIVSGGSMDATVYFLGGRWQQQNAAFFARPGRARLKPDEPAIKASSVVYNAERVSASVLINVSDYESLLAASSFTALKDAGRAVEMYVFPQEHHGKTQPVHKKAIYERNLDWMDFWLRNEEDTTPDKQGQYSRWRVLREKWAATQ